MFLKNFLIKSRSFFVRCHRGNRLVILSEVIVIWRCIINRALALREAKEERAHAVLVISKISLLASLFLVFLPHALLSLSSCGARTYPFFPLESCPALWYLFWHAPFRGSFLRFVLRYYSPRLSRFLAPRNSRHPLRDPLFCVRLVDRL